MKIMESSCANMFPWLHFCTFVRCVYEFALFLSAWMDVLFLNSCASSLADVCLAARNQELFFCIHKNQTHTVALSIESVRYEYGAGFFLLSRYNKMFCHGYGNITMCACTCCCLWLSVFISITSVTAKAERSTHFLQPGRKAATTNCTPHHDMCAYKKQWHGRAMLAILQVFPTLSICFANILARCVAQPHQM